MGSTSFIGDDRSVDLLRYTAWLMRLYLTPAAPTQSYEERKEAQRQRAAELARAGQDIGEIPDVVNAERRQCDRKRIVSRSPADSRCT